ncbi:MAG: transposase [Desulfobacterales bacterium]|nr:transposase [Desulfobacterales bacterium]
MKAKRARRVFDPKQKITAVLSIWTEQKNISQICQEMQISWALIDRWQNQAMDGMLAALSPKKPEHPRQLNRRLQQLIDKKTAGVNLIKLEKRLKKIQKKANSS